MLLVSEDCFTVEFKQRSSSTSLWLHLLELSGVDVASGFNLRFNIFLIDGTRKDLSDGGVDVLVGGAREEPPHSSFDGILAGEMEELPDRCVEQLLEGAMKELPNVVFDKLDGST